MFAVTVVAVSSQRGCWWLGINGGRHEEAFRRAVYFLYLDQGGDYLGLHV